MEKKDGQGLTDSKVYAEKLRKYERVVQNQSVTVEVMFRIGRRLSR